MVNNQLKIYIKERDLLLGEKIYLKKKKSLPGFARSPRSQVNRVLPGFFSCRFFTLLGPVKPLGRLGLRSTCQASPSLITMGQGSFWAFHIFCYNIITLFRLD